MLPPFTYKTELFDFKATTLCRVFLHPAKHQAQLQSGENQYIFEDREPLKVNPNWHPHYLGSFLASRIGCLRLWGFLPEKDETQKLKVPGFGSLSHTKVQDEHIALIAKSLNRPVGVDVQAKSRSEAEILRALMRVGIQKKQRPWLNWCEREVHIKAKVSKVYLLYEDESRCEVVGI